MPLYLIKVKSKIKNEMKANYRTTTNIVVEKRESKLNGGVAVAGFRFYPPPFPFQAHRLPSSHSLTLRRRVPAAEITLRRAVVGSASMRGGGVGVGGREDGDGAGGSLQRVDGENERAVDELFASSV